MRFLQFTDEWSKFAVSELLNTYPTNSLSWDKLSYIEKSKIKNIHYGLIHNGFKSTIISGNNQFIPFVNNSFIPKSYTLLQNGDLILADASEDRKDVGRPVEMMNVNNQKIISGLHTIHARNKTNLLINGFKGFYFQSYAMKKQIYKVANGSKIYGISPSSFNELFISVPNKEEQQKIVNLLQKIEGRIETQSKIISDYKTLKKGINYFLIGRYTPNTFISECLKCNTSSLKESEIIDENLGMFPVYGANGIIKNINTYMMDSSSISIVKDGAGAGRLNYLSGKYSFIGTLNCFTIKKGYNLKYIYYALENINFNRYIVGSGIPHVYYNDFKQEKIYIPADTKEIDKIEKCLSSIDSVIELETKKLSKLTLQKKYLINNMFI